MNKKVISIFFILLLVSTIAPVFSENNTTKNITVDGVTFELPQKYQGSSVGSDGHVYMLDTVFDFAIRSMYSNDYLVDEYGYAIEKAIKKYHMLSLHLVRRFSVLAGKGTL